MNRTHRTLDHCNPGNWKLGVFYVCRSDRRLLVPKRVPGLGWTLNFGHRLAFPLLAGLFVAAVWWL